MGRCYAVVRNRNTTQGRVSVEWMKIIGASTNRGLTGQGMGVKMAGVQAAIAGLGFARASHDAEGQYIAWYELKDYEIDGHKSQKVFLMVKRPGKGIKEDEMDLDANAFKSAWAENSIGRDYPIIREPILDAADEDPSFGIDKVSKLDYAPIGWTYTYVEIPDDAHLPEEERSAIGLVLDAPDYFFRRLGDVKWLSDTVGVGDLSSVNETRLYITAEDAPLAYVGYSTGDPSPEPAYDYIMRETPGQKWASMPKRTLENMYDAKNAIRLAVQRCNDSTVLRNVFNKIIQGGFEDSISWTWGTWRHLEAVRTALESITNGLPIHSQKGGMVAVRATLEGIEFAVLPNVLYELGRECGMQTLSRVVGMREAGETVYRKMRPAEKDVFVKVRKTLSSKMPWLDFSSHSYVAIESDFLGVHYGSFKGSSEDVIGINFEKLAGDRAVGEAASDPGYLRDVAATMIHELCHHERIESSMEDHHHGNGFIRDLAMMMAPPFTG